jgi:hypothetical protein
MENESSEIDFFLQREKERKEKKRFNREWRIENREWSEAS